MSAKQRDLILWRRLDQSGHEFCQLFSRRSCRYLAGTAVFAYERQPCRLDYQVMCDLRWKTLSGKVGGWVGNKAVEIEISVSSAHRWKLNGKEYAGVAGCIDLDLNFSPSTNLIAIRRLNLAAGHEAKAKAAWLRFPDFTLEPLEQLYRRIDTATYHYESDGGQFATELQVNAAGFVTRYPNFWEVEETA